MTNKIYKTITISILALFLLPALAFAHQPRITESRLTQVPEPEISKSYYGKFTGEPDVYTIEETEPFDLYVNVLVPDFAGQKKDVSAVILKNSAELAVLDGANFEWKNFFEVSPVTFIKSHFGWGLIVVMYLLAGIVVLIYRAILKKFAKNSARGATHNIGKADRLLRLAIGAVLLLWAITTSWNPILLFFSGFALFEAIFSWCGFYAAIGKNTCPR